MMSVPVADKLLTADEFDALPETGQDQELIQGVVHEMAKPGPRHAKLSMRLSLQLARFIEMHGGGVALSECGFVVQREPDTVRAPDLAVLDPEHADMANAPSFIDVPPAIAIEINSPNDLASEVADKARMWISHGVKQVCVVDDPTRTVTVYYPDDSPRVFGENQTLTTGPALPGFTLALAELF